MTHQISDDELLDEIERLSTNNDPPAQNDMTDDGEYSVITYRRRWGSWNEAIEAAGYEPREYQEEISDDELLEEIHRLAQGEQSPPSQDDIRQDGEYSVKTYYLRWGSWNEALQAAGYSPIEKKNANKKELLAELKRLASEKDSRPTQMDMESEGEFSVGPYYREWGSWAKALQAAGYSVGENGRITESQLINELHRLADGNTPPTRADMIDDGEHDPTTYQRRWGSWNEALRAAGYSPVEERKISTTDLIQEVKWVGERVDRTPAMSDMENKGDYSPSVYLRRFGSWNEAVRAAGYQPNIRSIPKNDLLNEIEQVAAKVGGAPSQSDMLKRGSYSISPYRRQWGSWNDAIRAAGYEPVSFEKKSEHSLINELQRLKTDLGRVPTAGDMNRFGRFSEGPYLDHFHSWWAAVLRSGFIPHRMYPLCPEAIHRFHRATISKRSTDPMKSLVCLLFQFTGLTPTLISQFESDWVVELADEYIVSIPTKYTNTQTRWEFRIPETWKNPHTNTEENTYLPEFIRWYFQTNQSFDFERPSYFHVVYKLAAEADLTDLRKPVVIDSLGEVPRVRPVDLQMTHGVHVARNGAPKQFIQKRLGLNHINRYIDSEEVFIWLEERSQ